MAAEHWFRWHHGTVNDPKWRVVAARASSAMSRNVTVGHVLSVWAAMLECASQANPRGSLVGWDSEDVAAGLDIDQAEVSAIVDAMQGKTIEGEELTGWKRRQPKAEDGTAAGRKRAQRERDRATNSVVTDGDEGGCHGMSRNVTTETETETEEKEAKAASLRSASSSAAPDDLPGIPAAPAEAGKGDLAERLARVTDDAIAAYNSSSLVKSNGGHLPNVSPRVGREKRQAQVKRCLRVARSICEENTGSPLVVSGFWNDYFAAVALDDFYAGRQAGGAGHENFVPDFELLTREQTMLRIYDRTGGEAAA